jgi:type III secretion protein J
MIVPARNRPARIAMLLCLLGVTGCDADLYTRIDEQDANRMAGALISRGIDTKKTMQKDGSFTLSIPEGEFARAIAILDAAGLPGEPRVSLKDMFKGGGLVATPVQERAQLMVGLGSELARTIGTIDGVVTARVHVVLPESTPIKRDMLPSSAAVFIRHAPGMPIDSLIPRIKQLVAASIIGLDYEHVSVVAVPATGDAAQAAGAPPYADVLGIRMLVSSRPFAVSLFTVLFTALFGLVAALAYFLKQRKRNVGFELTATTNE